VPRGAKKRKGSVEESKRVSSNTDPARIWELRKEGRERKKSSQMKISPTSNQEGVDSGEEKGQTLAGWEGSDVNSLIAEGSGKGW